MAGATLVLVPDDGESRDILRLPDGTYGLHVEASWSVTEDGGRFRGGIAEFNIELEETR